MVKNLIKHGNSYALVIDKPIMELLDIQPDTPLDIKTDGNALIVTPIRSKERQAKFDKIHDEINKQYGPAFKKLADS